MSGCLFWDFRVFRLENMTTDSEVVVKQEIQGSKREREPQLLKSSEFQQKNKKQKIEFLMTIDNTINYEEYDEKYKTIELVNVYKEILKNAYPTKMKDVFPRSRLDLGAAGSSKETSESKDNIDVDATLNKFLSESYAATDIGLSEIVISQKEDNVDNVSLFFAL